MKLKVKKLDPNSKLPYYATVGAAGMDLTATSVDVLPDGMISYGTGIAIEVPKGYAGLVFPRSSISKTRQYLVNSVGLIDSDYRGEIVLKFKTITNGNGNYYGEGNRIGQLVIVKLPWVDVEEVDELSETERGDGGFGSTDKK